MADQPPLDPAPPTGDADRPADPVGPDLAEEDRFFVNGKAMPFADWVEAIMSPIAPRAPAAPEAQPAPEAPEVVWLSRRPVE
jgi:hypothetical protein